MLIDWMLADPTGRSPVALHSAMHSLSGSALGLDCTISESHAQTPLQRRTLSLSQENRRTLALLGVSPALRIACWQLNPNLPNESRQQF
jgi:hypothetical protein